MKIPFNAMLHTSGKGYWSTRRATVEITHIRLAYVDEDEEFGELRVYFATDTWDVDSDGLIYTDSLWLRELHTELEYAGYNADDVSYSEQGMQGNMFVSLDVGKDFIDSYKKKMNIDTALEI